VHRPIGVEHTPFAGDDLRRNRQRIERAIGNSVATPTVPQTGRKADRGTSRKRSNPFNGS